MLEDNNGTVNTENSVTTVNSDSSYKPERIQKIISDKGITTRREAEKMILSGRVLVNGVRAKIGQSANPFDDDIKVDGVSIPRKNTYYYLMLNKPRGYLTSCFDAYNRNIVLELVSEITDKAKIYPIGRLDKNSEGLLLLTNDGNFANLIMHPRYQLSKTYEVRVKGNLDSVVHKLSSPMMIDSVKITAKDVRLKKADSSGGILEIKIGEGRNRQVRKMCASVGLDVLSLKRIAIGFLKLGNLPLGKWRHLTENEVDSIFNDKM